MHIKLPTNCINNALSSISIALKKHNVCVWNPHVFFCFNAISACFAELGVCESSYLKVRVGVQTQAMTLYFADHSLMRAFGEQQTEASLKRLQQVQSQQSADEEKHSPISYSYGVTRLPLRPWRTHAIKTLPSWPLPVIEIGLHSGEFPWWFTRTHRELRCVMSLCNPSFLASISIRKEMRQGIALVWNGKKRNKINNPRLGDFFCDVS